MGPSTNPQTSALTYSMFHFVEPAQALDTTPRCVTRLHLLTETFLTEVDGVEQEVLLPALCATFDYCGTELRASDMRRRFFAATGGELQEIERDLDEEKRV